MTAPALPAQRESLAILLLAALLVRPRDCEPPPPASLPAPAVAVRERAGRLERALPGDWRGHTSQAAAAEGPPYCWWAIDEAFLSAAGVPAATAVKLVRHMEDGGTPDAGSLHDEALLPRRQAERWSKLFRLQCQGRDLHLEPAGVAER